MSITRNKNRTDGGLQKDRKVVWTRFPVVFLTAFFCCALWGSASPAIKIGYQIFEIPADDTPSRILFAGVRFVIAGLMVIGYESAREKKFIRPSAGTWKYVLRLAAVQTVIHYIFFYMGLAHTSGVKGSVINAAETFFSIFLAAFLFRFEKLTFRKVIGSVLGFFGVVLMVTGGSLEGLSGRISLAGEGSMVLAAFTSALAGCLIKRYAAWESTVVLSGWQFLTGGLFMTLVGMVTGGRLTFTSGVCAALLLYMGFISAGAYTLWGILLSYNPVSTITVLGFMNPVMGVLLSALFLHEGSEAFRLTTVLALALVAFGIIIVNVVPGRSVSR